MEQERKCCLTKKQIYGCLVFVGAIILALIVSYFKESSFFIPKLSVDKLGMRQGDFIKIGAILPLTEKQSSYGVPLKNVLELAVKEINAQGGARSHNFELFVEDGVCNSNDAEKAMEKLVKEEVRVVIGGFCDKETLGALPVAEKYKIPLISGSTKNSFNLGQNLFFVSIFPNKSFSPNYKNEKFQNLSRLYKEQYKKELSHPVFAELMYDAVFLTRDAIIGVGLDGEKIAKWFRSVVEWPGASGLISINANGERVGF
ncbi:MAG: ABC transporter substrate-binding protein [Patescibacteria group bacterium]|nr:ABC transporter substrate-binding protein [Patescibacteria group bacterium]